MYYTETEAREAVIAAGLTLLERGLVSRTWGNISARISEDECIITPSGRSYTGLAIGDLVRLRLSDLSCAPCGFESFKEGESLESFEEEPGFGSFEKGAGFESFEEGQSSVNCLAAGRLRPSSEKALHAGAYKLRPDINFIIHTHQFYASVISAAGLDMPFAPAGAYAPPGSGALSSNIVKLIRRSPEKQAFLMEKHGALCLGRSSDEAFDTADMLEGECRAVFEADVCSGNEDLFSVCAGRMETLPAYLDDFAQLFGESVSLKKTRAEICAGEDFEARSRILDKNCAAALYALAKGAAPLEPGEARRQREVYLASYSKLIDKH